MGVSILWKRLDQPGHEAARWTQQPTGWQLARTAVFVHERQACRLDYSVRCDAEWRTRSARVDGWLGSNNIGIEISAGPDRRWFLDGKECLSVAGCIDLDLNFSPSTNTLPIRRLNLGIGQSAPARAAWLRFPGFVLEPLDQVYHRLGPNTYRCESAGGSFVSTLTVNDAGLVSLYPDLWVQETPES